MGHVASGSDSGSGSRQGKARQKRAGEGKVEVLIGDEKCTFLSSQMPTFHRRP
jgi:hypothetical protein